MIAQETQDHASARPVFIWLFGQLSPAFIRLPVLKKDLDEPSEGMSLHNIQGAPTQIGRDEIPIRLLPFVFEGNHKPFCLMRTDGDAGAAHPDAHLVAATNPNGLPHSWIPREQRGDMHRLPLKAHRLILPQVTDDLHAPKDG